MLGADGLALHCPLLPVFNEPLCSDACCAPRLQRSLNVKPSLLSGVRQRVGPSAWYFGMLSRQPPLPAAGAHRRPYSRLFQKELRTKDDTWVVGTGSRWWTLQS